MVGAGAGTAARVRSVRELPRVDGKQVAEQVADCSLVEQDREPVEYRPDGVRVPVLASAPAVLRLEREAARRLVRDVVARAEVRRAAGWDTGHGDLDRVGGVRQRRREGHGVAGGRVTLSARDPTGAVARRAAPRWPGRAGGASGPGRAGRAGLPGRASRPSRARRTRSAGLPRWAGRTRGAGLPRRASGSSRAGGA